MARRSDHTSEELHSLILDGTRQLIRERGASQLSARKIADRIGYTVGTIYQYFASIDRLVEAVNTATLQALYERSKSYAEPHHAGESLVHLAKSFLNFTRAHPQEWDAVITWQYGAEHRWSEEYASQVENLLGLISLAISELYGPDEETKKREDVLVLWCGLYGVYSLASVNRLGADYPAERMIGALAQMFLDARAKENRNT